MGGGVEQEVDVRGTLVAQSIKLRTAIALLSSNDAEEKKERLEVHGV